MSTHNGNAEPWNARSCANSCGSGPSCLGIATPRSHTRAMPAKKRAVYLNADLHRSLRAKSATMDLTVAELVSSAVRAYLADAADERRSGSRSRPCRSEPPAAKKRQEEQEDQEEHEQTLVTRRTGSRPIARRSIMERGDASCAGMGPAPRARGGRSVRNGRHRVRLPGPAYECRDGSRARTAPVATHRCPSSAGSAVGRTRTTWWSCGRPLPRLPLPRGRPQNGRRSVQRGSGLPARAADR
jgi:hypothetical protein